VIDTKLENWLVEQSPEQRLGEDWIRAVAEGALDRLEAFCQPRVNSRLLTPGQFTELNKASDLVAKYMDWFEGCTDFHVEASRVERIGKRLGISYRFLLRDHDDWYRIEQDLFCTLKDGRCSSCTCCAAVSSGLIPTRRRSNDDSERQRADPRP